MRKLIFWLALCAGIIATPAFARDGAWYVGGEFGAMIVEDTNVDIGAVDNALRLSYDYGYDGGLFVGYDLGAFRIEAEAAYKKADLEAFNTIIALPGENPSTFPPSREFAGGSASALSFMINGMLDFGEDEEDGDISGFVGGGVGMARVKANNQRVFANTAPFLDDSDSKLAWQVFAGVRQRVTDNLDVTVKYRFFNVDKVRMVAFNGNESEHRFRSHSLLGGITFNFGCPKGTQRNADGDCIRIITEVCEGRPGYVEVIPGVCCPREQRWNATAQRCEPPCDAPLQWNAETQRCECPDGTVPYGAAQCCPPGESRDRNGVCCPPAKQKDGVCVVDCQLAPIPPGPVVIFFDWNKSEFVEKTEDTPASWTGRSQSDILQEVVDVFNCGREVQLRVYGHADRSGRPSRNDPLSVERAETIRRKLIDKEVPAHVITIKGYGETEQRVPTADGVKEVENRRVEIYLDS